MVDALSIGFAQEPYVSHPGEQVEQAGGESIILVANRGSHWLLEPVQVAHQARGSAVFSCASSGSV